MIERETLRLKTRRAFLLPSTAKKGEHVEIVGGAFKGFAGKVVDVDGEWLTVEAPKQAKKS